MTKKLIAALAATAILASGFADAQYYEPIDGHGQEVLHTQFPPT
jgi:hypothetical protein